MTTACHICERAQEKQHAPRERRDHEERLRDLNQLAAVVPIRQRAGVERKQQERHPVADDGEARQRRRMKRLEHHPVADDVLDVVGRHRHQVEGEVFAVGGIMERGEFQRAALSPLSGMQPAAPFYVQSGATRVCLEVPPRRLAWNLSAAADNHAWMPTARPSDVELVRRAAAGDRDGVCGDLRAAPDGGLRFARLMSGSDATAEDVTQEVFVTLIHTLPSYEPQRAGPADLSLRCRAERDAKPSSPGSPVRGAGDGGGRAVRPQTILTMPRRGRRSAPCCGARFSPCRRATGKPSSCRTSRDSRTLRPLASFTFRWARSGPG